MKALILAAGMGSRLRPMTQECPKALVRVHGQPILRRQIEGLHNNGIEDITVVAGYQGQRIREAAEGLGAEVMENQEFSATNNMYSAWIAREKFSGEDFLLMNGDVFFEDALLGTLLAFPGENAIATREGEYRQESMKVAGSRNRLKRISKDIKRKEAFGISLDIYKFSREASALFFDACGWYIVEKKERGLWSEEALNVVLSESVFRPCPVKERWAEIDSLEDLKEADRIFGQHRRPNGCCLKNM